MSGQAEFASEVKQRVLNQNKEITDVIGQRFGHHKPDQAVQFINLTHSFDSGRSLWHPGAVTQSCCTIITGSGVDLA